MLKGILPYRLHTNCVAGLWTGVSASTVLVATATQYLFMKVVSLMVFQCVENTSGQAGTIKNQVCPNGPISLFPVCSTVSLFFKEIKMTD